MTQNDVEIVVVKQRDIHSEILVAHFYVYNDYRISPQTVNGFYTVLAPH